MAVRKKKGFLFLLYSLDEVHSANFVPLFAVGRWTAGPVGNQAAVVKRQGH